MKEITMSYGRQGLRVRLDDDWQLQVIRKPVLPALAEPARTLEATLDMPVAAM